MMETYLRRIFTTKTKNMKTNHKKYEQKAADARRELEIIKNKYPGIDLESFEFLTDMAKVYDLISKIDFEDMEANSCKSDDPNDMCSFCNCWKSTRNSCS